MKRLKTQIMVIMLCVMLTISMSSPVFAVGRAGSGAVGGGGGSMGFFDGLDAFGNSTATIGCILNVGSTLANANWDDPGSVCVDLVDTIFGTSFGGDPTQAKLDSIYSDVSEIKQTTNQIKESVDYLVDNSRYVNQQLSAITGSLRTVNSQLVRQTQMLTGIAQSLNQMDKEMKASFTNLSNMIDDQTNTLTSVVYDSTAEIKKTTALNNALQDYVSKYSELYTKDNIILEELGNKQKRYETFYEKVLALDDGEEIMEALSKLTLQEDSVSKLSARERELLANNTVKIGSKNHNVLQFHQNYVEDLMEFVAGTGSDSSYSVYTLNGYSGNQNIGDIVIGMGDYLTAANEDFNKLTGSKGIGEMYYLYCTYSESDSETVHAKYRAFMDSMVARYMTTAWLAEMALGCRISDEANGNGNDSRIQRYVASLNRIHAQMIKVYAYYDFEYRKCINLYDYGGDASGHGQEVIYYGNTVNDRGYSVQKKNMIKVPSGLSENSIRLALGEQFDLHYYFKYSDVSARKGIVWSSSNPSVAAVDSRGEVIGLSRGVAKITAEYMDTKEECLVSIGDVMAIGNEDGVNRYHYLKYTSNGEDWDVDDSLCYEEPSGKDSNAGYDYYYGITTYIADTVELSEDVRAASVTQTTGLSNQDLEAFHWAVAGDQSVQKNGNEISAVSGGWSEVIGYKKNEANHTYDFIGIPVYSSMETLHDPVAADYSEYTKISSAQDLIDLANDPNGWEADKKYVLTNDIDLGGMEWSPIGYCIGFGNHSETDAFMQQYFEANNIVSPWSATKPFKGTFDGNGHTVRNFKVTKIHHLDAAVEEYNSIIARGKTINPYNGNIGFKLSVAQAGLFGLVYGGSIKDLSVADVTIDIDTSRGVKDDKGQDLKLGDNTVAFADTFTMFAGGLIGANFWDPFGSKVDYYQQKYYNGSDLDGNKLEAFKAEVDLPGYFSEEFDKALSQEGGRTQENLNQYGTVLLIYGAIEASKKAQSTSMVGCYASGSVNVRNGASSGMTYSGMLAGGSSADLDRCVAVGKVSANGSKGANGGLIGVQYLLAGSRLENCTSYADVESTGDAAAGGLAGAFSGTICFDTNISFPKTVSNDSEKEKMFDRLNNAAYAILLVRALSSGISCGDYTSDKPNALVRGNEVLGSVNGQGAAGGLAGSKDSLGIYAQQLHYDVDQDDVAKDYYNFDVCQNYVACDVKSENGKAGGLFGEANMGMEEGHTASGGDGYTVSRGTISKNYYTGKVDAGTGIAAGLVAAVEKDYSDLKQNISAATDLIGGGNGKVAYAVNGRENGMPLVNGSGEGWNVAGALCYNPGFSYFVGDDKCTKGDANTFNNPETYTKVLGGDSLLDLSGGLKPDGTVGLDIANGIVPGKLESRYRFPTETVPHSYNQGEAFVPVTSVFEYTGTGTNTITNNVTSTRPDMTKIGVQKVTLTYGDYTDTYDIVIYPSAGYLQVTKAPSVKKNGSAISGGEVTLFENNGSAGRKISIDNCSVKKNENGVFVIKSGSYTTAFRPVMIDVFTNSLKSPQAEYLGTEYYAPGASADVSGLIPETRTYNGKTYSFCGTSEPVTFKASSDKCILSFYAVGGSAAGTSVSAAKVSSIGKKVYTGKAIKPTPSVTLNGKKLQKGTDYKLSYKNNTKVGKASVTITGIGKYKGTKTVTFMIVPAKAVISKATSKAYKITVVVKSQKKSGVTGYQIAYKKGSGKFKYKKVTSTKAVLKGLAKKKKYTIKVRAYKKVGKTMVYGAWSKAKKLKTKR